MNKFLRIEKSLTSSENVVLTIVHRRPGATLLNCDEEHRIEVCAEDLGPALRIPDGTVIVDKYDLRRVEDIAGEEVQEYDVPTTGLYVGTIQGL